MGNEFEAVTEDINYKAGIRLAEMAAAKRREELRLRLELQRLRRGEHAARAPSEDEVNPLTAYARSKIATEEALAKIDRRRA